MKWMLVTFLAISHNLGFGQIYTSVDNDLEFTSEAPLELIQASSGGLQGVLDLKKKAFAFQVNIQSFKGFNSPLQQTHFYENYLEVGRYPLAFFKGKVIENITNTNRDYRAKGILEIHGIQREVIIPVEILLGEDHVRFSSQFEILLMDYDIEIPRIVYQKIAESIKIHASGKLMLRK